MQMMRRAALGILAAVLAVLMHLPKIKKLHPIVFVAIAAAAGIVFNFHP